MLIARALELTSRIHSVSWEKAPADYSMLKLVKLPKAGGDTMFASGEALYERLSPSFAAYLETLEAVHAGTAFLEEVQRNGGGLYQGERGVSCALKCRSFRLPHSHMSLP